MAAEDLACFAVAQSSEAAKTGNWEALQAAMVELEALDPFDSFRCQATVDIIASLCMRVRKCGVVLVWLRAQYRRLERCDTVARRSRGSYGLVLKCNGHT